MFGEGFEGEVGVEVVEGGEWGVGVGEAGVCEAREGVVVAVRRGGDQRPFSSSPIMDAGCAG